MKTGKWLSLVLLAGLIIGTLVLSGCYTTSTNEAGEQVSTFDWLTTGIFVVAIAAIFYFLMYRPQRKKQKEQKELMEGLQRGDSVITIGGIYGQIDSMDEETITIKVESGALIRLTRAAIAGKRNK
jgi:preprotein translocase subunit YajC